MLERVKQSSWGGGGRGVCVQRAAATRGSAHWLPQQPRQRTCTSHAHIARGWECDRQLDMVDSMMCMRGGGVGHDLAIVPHGTIACGRLSKAISSATGVRDPLACSRFVVWDDFLNAASEAHASRTRLE